MGSANDRIVKSYEKTVSAINKLEPKYIAMSDDEIHGLTAVFRERLKNGESENGHRWLCFRFYFENNVFLFNLCNDIGKTNTVMFIITSDDFKYQLKKAESVNGFESAYCILDKKFYDIINQVNEKK